MRKRWQPFVFSGLLAALFAGLAVTGCAVHAVRPGVLIQPAPVVVAHPGVVYATVPPARVYYDGHWLVYRDYAYYYYQGGSWVVAPSVPFHVARYHRPYGPYYRWAPVHVSPYGYPWHYHGTRYHHYGHHRHHHKLWSGKV